MKLYSFVVHYLQMCIQEYGCCPKFKMGDNSTYTFTKRRRACTLQAKLLLSSLLDIYETLHSCNTLSADVHEGIRLLSKIWKGRSFNLYSEIRSVWRDGLVSATLPKRLIGFK